jgi:hypothetical protein
MNAFEKENYQEEKKEFMSDKCSDCMHYLDEETNECKNKFCEGKIPDEFRNMFQ